MSENIPQNETLASEKTTETRFSIRAPTGGKLFPFVKGDKSQLAIQRKGGKSSSYEKRLTKLLKYAPIGYKYNAKAVLELVGCIVDKQKFKRFTAMEFAEPLAPTVPCFPRIDTQGWQFLCPYCLVWHYHGKGLGHRVAHCAKPTPYSQTGYVLEAAVPRKANGGMNMVENKLTSGLCKVKDQATGAFHYDLSGIVPYTGSKRWTLYWDDYSAGKTHKPVRWVVEVDFEYATLLRKISPSRYVHATLGNCNAKRPATAAVYALETQATANQEVCIKQKEAI